MTKEELIKLGVPEEAAQKVAEAIQSAGAGAENLDAEVARLKTELDNKDKTHAAEINAIKVDAAVASALGAAKARNVKAVKALLELDKAELDADGTVKGLTEQLKKLQGTDGYLFDSGSAKPAIRGAAPAETGVEGADGKVDTSKMNYEELLAYKAANPDAEI